MRLVASELPLLVRAEQAALFMVDYDQHLLWTIREYDGEVGCYAKLKLKI